DRVVPVAVLDRRDVGQLGAGSSPEEEDDAGPDESADRRLGGFGATVLVAGVRWTSRCKDAGSPDSGAIGATEDAAARRSARPCDSATVPPDPPPAQVSAGSGVL